MKKRRLGKSGLEVSAIGMGCMGFSHGYGAVPSEGESIRLMRKAYDEYGCTLFDTAEVYATYANEELVGKALKPIRDNVILTTKFMPVFLPGQEIPEGKLSRKGLRNALESSLKRLQTEYIDLYYEHRVPEDSDPAEVAFWMPGTDGFVPAVSLELRPILRILPAYRSDTHPADRRCGPLRRSFLH